MRAEGYLGQRNLKPSTLYRAPDFGLLDGKVGA